MVKCSLCSLLYTEYRYTKMNAKFVKKISWAGYGLGQTTKFDDSIEKLKNLSYSAIRFNKTEYQLFPY